MGKFDKNPFARAALIDSKLMAARNVELRKIRFLLRNSSQQPDQMRSIIITGTRGVGKTSFLNIIANDCNAYSFIPIRINLTNQNTANPSEFFWFLFDQILLTAFDFDLFGGKNGPIDVAIQSIINCDNSEDPANWVFKTPLTHQKNLKNNRTVFDFEHFIFDLTKIREEIENSKTEKLVNKSKILLLVDEAHLIYSKPDIIEAIRYIVQRPNLGVGFVFAGDESFESSEWEKIFGGSHRDFEIIRLGYFKEVDEVVEFFSKSLESIGWTNKEIQETLFYRLKKTCWQVMNLTSGRPEWINFIARKMFDRCMEGESNILKFDRQTQNEIKQILEDSGRIDKEKLRYIDLIPHKNKKWLAKIFASELSTLKEVYFFGKFILQGEDQMSLEEFEDFCNQLIERGIIYLLKKENKAGEIGYLVKKENNGVFSSPYLAFGNDSGTIKHWLQISSDGKFKFGYYRPEFVFIESINKEFVREECSIMAYSDFCHEGDLNSFRFSQAIKNINANELHILNESFDNIYQFYKVCKKIANSTVREVLYAELRNNTSNNFRYWNLINLDEKDNLVGFYNNPKKIEKFKELVSAFNTEGSEFLFDFFIEAVDRPNLEKFQKIIIKSGDRKKLGIITDDKMEDLFNFYLNKPDQEKAKSSAIFFLELFEDGFDLKIQELNNAGYVFMASENLEKARMLFAEGRKKIRNKEIEDDELVSAVLLLYNSAILEVSLSNYEKALERFYKVSDFVNEKEVSNELASVLNLVELNSENKLEVIEVRENNEKFPKINPLEFTYFSINSIKEYFKTNLE
jgi:hypothetical protein